MGQRGKSLNLNKDLLYNLYIKQKKSTIQIGKILNCTHQTILKYLCKYDIPIRHPKKKLNFNKSLLYDLYIKQEKSIVQIGEILNCAPNAIYGYLHKYGISIRPKSFAPIKIEGSGEQVLLGSLLGDGHLSPSGRAPSYAEKHGIKQKEYLLWKQRLLPFETTYGEGVEHFPQFLRKYYTYCRIWSKRHLEFKEYFTLKYKDKNGLQRILNRLDAFGLLIWHFDDGCYCQATDRIIISCELTSPGYQIVENWFKQKYGIIAKRTKGGYRFSAGDSKKLLAIFHPYLFDIPSSMYYKVGLDEEKRVEVKRKYREQSKKWQKKYDQKPIVKGQKRQYYQKHRSEILRRQKEYRQRLKVKAHNREQVKNDFL